MELALTICSYFFQLFFLDTSDPNSFAHNDIVWAPINKNLKMPARVVDLRMRSILKDFPLDRALSTKPKGDEHTLIIFFDLIHTW